jgi:hypothetical protein
VKQIVDWIRAAVAGDVAAVASLADLPHTELVDAMSHTSGLIVTSEAVLRALKSYRRGEVSASEVHQWAWFVMRGYIPGSSRGPISTLEIDYQEDAADEIAAALTRFSELGDKVDGALEGAELDEIARRLGSP